MKRPKLQVKTRRSVKVVSNLNRPFVVSKNTGKQIHRRHRLALQLVRLKEKYFLSFFSWYRLELVLFPECVQEGSFSLFHELDLAERSAESQRQLGIAAKSFMLQMRTFVIFSLKLGNKSEISTIPNFPGSLRASYNRLFSI